MNTIEVSDRKRLIHSSLVSLGFWFIVAMIVILVPVTKNVVEEEKFLVVAINLTALPAAAPAPAAPAAPAPAAPAAAKTVTPAAPAASPKPAQTASAKTSAPAAKAAAKTSTAKAVTTAKPASSAKTSSSEKVAPAAKAAPAGLGIPNFSTPITSTTGTTDASESLDFSSKTESTHPATVSKPRGGTPTAELEGSAATVTKDTGSKTVSGSGSAKTAGSVKTAGSGAASSETSSTLAQIALSAKSGTGKTAGNAAAGSGTGSAEGSSSVSGNGVSGAGGSGSSITGLSFDGAQRKLLYPANPSIVLPESLRKLIDSDRTVTVSFSVRADGSVPGGLIVFTPTAIIPAEIRDYLRKEFSSWRFEKGGEDGQAKFLYSIKVE